MKRIMLKIIYKNFISGIIVGAGIIHLSNPAFGQDDRTTPKTIVELRQAIEKVMEETGMPAVGVALINHDGSVWTTGLGKSDMENNVAADENTMFRIGSVSKMFVSMAILKLQEQGLVNLRDEIRNIIPEIGFENPWADEAPILVEHLLEHTTGWNELHMSEMAYNIEGESLKEGLDYHPQSRISRWVPGTRASYCSSGVAVAAYIVEKITGQVFEDYIQENFFDPMGMYNATFFNSQTYQQLGAKLYHNNEPQPYWHILMRPMGAMNASPKEMLNMIRFMLNRGRMDSTRILTEKSLIRMETPLSGSGARAGLEYGWGLTNQSSVYKQFVYRQHTGGVIHGLTDFSYLPEHNLGYVFMTTSGNLGAYYRITELIRSFQTAELTPTHIEIAKKSSKIENIEGYYIPINPRFDLFYFMERLFDVQQIFAEEDSYFMQGLVGEKEEYVVFGDYSFKSPETGKISMVSTDDPLDGRVMHVRSFVGEKVLKRIPTPVIYGLFILFALWLLSIFSGLILGLVWSIQYARGRLEKGANTNVRLWPLLPSVLIILLIFILVVGINDNNPLELFGTFGFMPFSVFIITILFALGSLWSLFYTIGNYRIKMNRIVYWYATASAGLHVFVSCYLLWYGIIGVRIWIN